MTRISSAGRPRSEGARTKVEASEIEFWPTKNEGTMFLTISSMLPAGWALSSSAPTTSTGEGELVTLRSVRRVPMTTIESELSVADVSVSAGLVWAKAGSARKIARLAAVAASAALRLALNRMENSVLGYPPSSRLRIYCGNVVAMRRAAHVNDCRICPNRLLHVCVFGALSGALAQNQSSEDFIANIGVCGSCAAIRVSSRSSSLSAIMIP